MESDWKIASVNTKDKGDICWNCLVDLESLFFPKYKNRSRDSI